MTQSMRRAAAALVLALLSAAVGCDEAGASGRYYYVSCRGNDDASGLSASTAWRSIVRANRASLQPGDHLLLERGCTWLDQRLEVSWTGTSTSRIIVGAYGSGAKPVLGNGPNSTVRVTGSHLLIRDLDVIYDTKRAGTPVTVTPSGCTQPVDTVYGFNFTDDAHHAELRGSRAAGFTAGAHLGRQSHHIRLIGNLFEGNSIMERFGGDPAQDLGAWGVNSNSDDGEIAYNTFRENKAQCRNQGFKIASNSVELFETQRTKVHHNRSYGDRVFTELGGSSGDRAADNVFAYNLMVSSVDEARFLVARGSGNSWGPVWRTVAVHNTVVLTGRESQAVSCGGGCNAEILVLRSNILWAEGKVLYADGPIDEGDNIYWSSNGAPVIDAPSMSSSSRAANPKFVDRSAGNYQIQATSPALDRGGSTRGHTTDLANTPVPQNEGPDIGAFERA